MAQCLSLLVKIPNHCLRQWESSARETLSAEGRPVTVKTNGSWWVCMFSRKRERKTGAIADRTTLTGGLGVTCLVHSTQRSRDTWWTALKSTYDSHPYSITPVISHQRGLSAKAEIPYTDMLRFIFAALHGTHESLSCCLPSQFETLYIYPGQHITAQPRSSFHGPTQAEIHCGDLIWQVLDDQPAREYEKWLWDHKASAAIGSLWKCWLSGRMSGTSVQLDTQQETTEQLFSSSSVPYILSIGAADHSCHPRGRKGAKMILHIQFIQPIFMMAGQLQKNLTSNSMKRENLR